MEQSELGKTSLQLLHAERFVVATPQADGTRYDLTFAHAPLGAETLHSLLRNTAPAPGADTTLDVLADWRILKSDRKDDERLLAMHRPLGSAWTEFGASIPALTEVYQDLPDQAPALIRSELSLYHELPFPIRSKDQITALDVCFEAVRQRSGEFGALYDVLEGVGLEDTKTLVLDGLCAAINRTRNARSQLRSEQKIMAHLYKISPYKRNQILESVVARLSPEQAQALVDRGLDEFYEVFQLEDAIYYTHKLDRQKKVYEVIKATEKVQVGRYEAYVVEAVSRYRGGVRGEISRKYLVRSSIAAVRPAATISPRISWIRRADGVREFVFERTVEDRGHRHHVDSVLGVVALAYLSPNTRRDWPRTMRLSGSEKAQRLGAAQIGVLALLPRMQRELLSSDVIFESEAAA